MRRRNSRLFASNGNSNGKLKYVISPLRGADTVIHAVILSSSDLACLDCLLSVVVKFNNRHDSGCKLNLKSIKRKTRQGERALSSKRSRAEESCA